MKLKASSFFSPCAFKKNFLFHFGVQLINNVVIVAGEHKASSLKRKAKLITL